MKWACQIFDSLDTGTPRYLADKKGILFFNTKKDAKNFCYNEYGKEWTDYCIAFTKKITI